MKKYTLNGRKMTSREEAYEHISETLEFPEYAGKNLDALYDLLSVMSAEVELKNACDMLKELRGYGCKILKCFFDASEDNGNFKFTVK
ncbi:MAG: barstar family protein [Clostridia bacterium]|nr:barstar family protein [Clostridia bacterium]